MPLTKYYYCWIKNHGCRCFLAQICYGSYQHNDVKIILQGVNICRYSFVALTVYQPANITLKIQRVTFTLLGTSRCLILKKLFFSFYLVLSVRIQKSFSVLGSRLWKNVRCNMTILNIDLNCEKSIAFSVFLIRVRKHRSRMSSSFWLSFLFK